MLAIYSIRIYMLVYFCWRLIMDSIQNGRPDFSLPENVYSRISDACRVLASLRITTEEDEKELQKTMTILYLNDHWLTWYPYNKSIIPTKDIVLKFYLIIKPLGRNFSDINAYTINDTMFDDHRTFVWVPINESVVQLDKNMGKWIPINESLVRRQRGLDTNKWYPVNESLLQLDSSMFKWYPINDTLVKLNNDINSDQKNEPLKQLQNDTVSWYPINDSLVRLDDNTIKWIPIDVSLNAMSEDFVKQINKTACDRPLKHVGDDPTINWYPVNKTHVALKRPDIDVTKETKVIIHGFAASALNEVTFRLARAFNSEEMYNVLLIDVEKLLGKVYFKSVRNARIIGKAIADLIIYLETFGADAADFHLLGVSLGAHVAGWAGKYFRHIEGRRIGRITGLDPAGPCYAKVPPSERLDKTDAMYVDVVHTNVLVQGLFEPIGHADFYFNGGGPNQPGCFLPTCSHLAAAYFYTESIIHPGIFIAVKCDNWWQFKMQQCRNKTVMFGHSSSLDTRGLYYLRTSENNPYGLGMEGIRPE